MLWGLQESGELVLGGGTSVILPEGEGVRKYEVVLSMGCAVHPGSADPICFAGKTLKDVNAGPTPPPTPGQGTRPEPEVRLGGSLGWLVGDLGVSPPRARRLCSGGKSWAPGTLESHMRGESTNYLTGRRKCIRGRE